MEAALEASRRAQQGTGAPDCEDMAPPGQLGSHRKCDPVCCWACAKHVKLVFGA